MKVHQVYLKNLLRNFNYILYSEKTKHAIIFDPYDAWLIERECLRLGITPRWLLNTHCHFDHIKGNKKFLAVEGREKLELQDGEIFELSSEEKIECVHTPGHVDDHFCYFLYEKEKLTGIITGDMIFNAGAGNCKNGGNPNQLYQSFKNTFLNLADDVKIYPSHDYFMANLKFANSLEENKSIDEYIQKVKNLGREEFLITTIGEERKYNPFFRCFQKDYRSKFNLDEESLFVELRSQRDTW